MLESTAENREPISSGTVYTGLSLVKSHWTFIALLSLARVLGPKRGKNSSGGPASGGVIPLSHPLRTRLLEIEGGK